VSTQFGKKKIKKIKKIVQHECIECKEQKAKVQYFPCNCIANCHFCNLKNIFKTVKQSIENGELSENEDDVKNVSFFDDFLKDII
jgi:hypothetical protein